MKLISSYGAIFRMSNANFKKMLDWTIENDLSPYPVLFGAREIGIIDVNVSDWDAEMAKYHKGEDN